MKKQFALLSLLGLTLFSLHQAHAQCSIAVTIGPAFNQALFHADIPEIDFSARAQHSESKERLSDHSTMAAPRPFRAPYQKYNFLPNRDILRKKRTHIHS